MAGPLSHWSYWGADNGNHPLYSVAWLTCLFIPLPSCPWVLVGVLRGRNCWLQAAVCHSRSAETDCDCGRWARATQPRQTQALLSVLSGLRSLDLDLFLGCPYLFPRHCLLFVWRCSAQNSVFASEKVPVRSFNSLKPPHLSDTGISKAGAFRCLEMFMFCGPSRPPHNWRLIWNLIFLRAVLKSLLSISWPDPVLFLPKCSRDVVIVLFVIPRILRKYKKITVQLCPNMLALLVIVCKKTPNFFWTFPVNFL